jgi:hypothetical protein
VFRPAQSQKEEAAVAQDQITVGMKIDKSIPDWIKPLNPIKTDL